MRRAMVSLLLLVFLFQTAPLAAPEGDTPPACRVVGVGTAGVCTLWTRSLDGPGADVPGGDGGWTVLAAPSGDRVFAVGNVLPLDGGAVGITVAYDAHDGAVAWTHERTHASGGAASDRTLALSPDGGRLHVLGHDAPPDRQSILTTLDASEGDVAWQLAFPHAGFGQDLAVGPAGTIFVSSGPTASMAAISAAGEVDWRTPISLVDRAATTEVRVSADGTRVFAAGAEPFGSWVAALDAATGALEWKTSLPLGIHMPRLQEMVSTPDDSRLFVAGTAGGLDGDGWDYHLVGIDAGTGEVDWTVRYDEPSHSFEAAWAVDVAPDGSRFYVTGLGTSPAGDDDYLTLALDPTDGSILWKGRFNAGTFTSDDVFGGIVASPDGKRVYVGGTSSLHPAQMTIAAYDAATGLEAWRFAYLAERDPVFGHAAWGLDVSPDSRALFVTGDANQDLFTMALDSELGLGLPAG